MMALKLDDFYRGRRIPPWLRRFEDDPAAALHDLLLGRAALGHLNPVEPSQLLRDWMEGLGEPMVESVDTALAAWIERWWGTPVLPRSADSAALSADAWRRAFDVLGAEPRMTRSAEALRRFMPEERAFLRALSEGRSRDPEGRAWLALARRQTNRGLITDWWRLCELPADVPWFHGGYGIQGLRHLPEESPGSGGGFPAEVAEGLVRFAAALERRIQDGWLVESMAESEFLRVARLTMWAYNFHNRWLPFWRQTLPVEGGDDRIVDGWVRKLFPDKLKIAHSEQQRRGKRQRLLPPGSLDEVKAVRYRLGSPDDTVVAEARKLLCAQRDYADATGDSHNVVRSAASFAGRVRKKEPELALEWLRLARRYDPSNAHAWTTEVAVLIQLERFNEARRAAFEAIRIAPYDPVAYNGLAETLRAQGQLKDAEDVYRDTTRRFSDDVVAVCGLAETLSAQGRIEDAEDAYRDAVHRFPENPIAPTGLGDVLRAQGRLDEAEAMYQETLQRAPRDRFATAGLRKIKWLRASQMTASEVAEPVTPYDPEPVASLQQDDVEIVLQDAYLLRHWARDRDPAERRERARRLLERLAETDERDASAAGERGLLGVAFGDLDDTLGLLRLAVERFPGSARVRYALAHAERAAAIRDHSAGENRLRPWKKLGRLDERLRPIQLLGEARTLLLRPEDMARDAARDRFGELGWWIERTLGFAAAAGKSNRQAPFNVEWARELRSSLFQEATVAQADDIKDLDALGARVETQAFELERQEEIYLSQIAII